ncbi:MAG TPA: cell division protein FtsW, partial [Flavobacteriaceae bacterium]|nr:cell division protein FtsW [Flavobacteriaceae bacterium]
MSNIVQKYFKGDKPLWAFILLLALFSFLPVYSASSNLVYTVGSGTIFGHLGKHAVILLIGLFIIYGLQRIDYRWFGLFALTAVVILSGVLAITLVQGQTIGGANAARWLTIPGTGIGIQPSMIASQALLIYIARYLTKNRDKEYTWKNTAVPLFLPIIVIVGLIFPSNGSTALMLAGMCGILLIIGGFPFKYLFTIAGVGLI